MTGNKEEKDGVYILHLYSYNVHVNQVWLQRGRVKTGQDISQLLRYKSESNFSGTTP